MNGIVPPHNLEAEQSVLGAMMLDKQCALEAYRLQADEFYAIHHKPILEAIQKLVTDGDMVDLITVMGQLEKDGNIQKSGGAGYVSGLSMAVPSTANFGYYMRIVKEHSYRRRVITSLTNAIRQAYEKADVQTIANIIRDAGQMDDNKTEKAWTSVGANICDTYMAIEERSKNQASGKLSGLDTGFWDLNGYTAGLQDGEMMVVAGRPSMGKTAFALNIANYTAQKYEASTVIFSLEMTKEALQERLLSLNSGIDLQKIRVGSLNEEDFKKLAEASQRMTDSRLIIDDTPGLTPTDIEYRLNRIEQEHGKTKLVIVDYLQFMRPTVRGRSRVEEVTDISYGMKSIAKKYKLPLILLAQLSRAPEARQNHRPQMSDLRESGAIEQDADLIAFLYRDEYYDLDTDKKGIAELIIGKQRNGPTGTIELLWKENIQKFRSAAPIWRECTDEEVPKEWTQTRIGA